jgi:polysaccharide biosynthesis protein PslG
VLGLALLALPTSPASARRAGPLVGVGEQHATMFASPAWRQLGLRDARYLTPWDTLDDPYQLSLLDAWMTAARQAHVRVLVGFGHSMRSPQLAGRLPTARQFEVQFKRLRRRYPWVRDWLAWNEANSPGGLTEHRPREAAQYFDAIARNCHGCRVVAADVIDMPGMGRWIKRFRRAAHHRPRIWGLHNYVDANQQRSTGTRHLLALTRGQVWFTETGGLVLRRTYRGPRVLRTYRYGEQRAARSTAQALRLGCLSPRVKRIYLYHWEAPMRVTSWDSGLLDAGGRLRPAYSVVRRALAGSRHDGGRVACSRR